MKQLFSHSIHSSISINTSTLNERKQINCIYIMLHSHTHNTLYRRRKKNNRNQRGNTVVNQLTICCFHNKFCAYVLSLSLVYKLVCCLKSFVFLPFYLEFDISMFLPAPSVTSLILHLTKLFTPNSYIFNLTRRLTVEVIAHTLSCGTHTLFLFGMYQSRRPIIK